MKRIYTLLLLGSIFLSLSATVKPRYRTTRRPVIHEQAAGVETKHRLGTQASAPLMSKGTPNVPVILVQFPDLRFRSGLDEGIECTTAAHIQAVNNFFNKFCNGDGVNEFYREAGSAGAIAEYFRDQSEGQFVPHFTPIGPVTLDQGYAYYGKNSGRSKDVNISAFYTDAINKAQELGIDWASYDNDGNGNVDMVFFLYAGEGENAFDTDLNPEAADYIWPKEMPSGSTIGGVRYGAYACCNELYDGKTDGIGVFVHELSHALGLPDFYDYNYVHFGMDYWDLMDSGNYCNKGYNPCGYSSYEKDFMGWQKLITLDTTKPEHLILYPVSLGGCGFKIVSTENKDEYYIIENRQNRRWDIYIGRGSSKQLNHGLLVTHVNYQAASWSSNIVNTVTYTEDQRFTIIPADGKLDSYVNVTTQDDYEKYMYSMAGDPFPGITGLNALEGEKAWVHTKTGSTPGLMNQPLRNIIENADGTIELDYCPFGNVPSGIDDISILRNEDGTMDVYDLQGRKVGKTSSPSQMNLPAGIYIIGKRKVFVR